MGGSELWGLLGLCLLGTLIWRFAGAAIAHYIDPASSVFQWLTCVAYGMLAALITRMLLIPTGALAETPTTDRLIAIATGFVVFFVFQCNFFFGTLSAFGVFLILSSLRGTGML